LARFLNYRFVPQYVKQWSRFTEETNTKEIDWVRLYWYW